MQIASIIIISILTILVFLLATKSVKLKSDKYLIAFLVTIIYGVLNDLFMALLPEHATYFRFGGVSVPLATAFLYMYTASLISIIKFPSLKYGLLFLPVLLVIGFSVFISEVEIINSSNMVLIGVYYSIKLGSPLLFIILADIELGRYSKRLKYSFSNIEKNDFKWLKVLINGSIMLFVMMFIGFILYKFRIIATINYLSVISNIFVFVFIIYLAYYGIKNTNTFKEVIVSNKIEYVEVVEKAEVAPNKISIDESFSADVIGKLEGVMEQEKPYLSEKLTIAQLAEMTDISQKLLSQIINCHYHQNFFDFINSYRIREFNKRIDNGELKNYTILSIAFDCGFNSKSAFNRAYKKHIGVPPSTFHKSGTTV